MTPIVDNESTQCAVFDQTPGSQQKKINIVVRPHFTVGRVISDIETQYSYKKFDLILQPYGEQDLVYLNDLELRLLYEVPGFERNIKNYLVLLPSGNWNGNVKQRFELPMKPTTLTTKTTKKSTTTLATTETKMETKKATATTTTTSSSTEATTINAETTTTATTNTKVVKKTSPKKTTKTKTVKTSSKQIKKSAAEHEESNTVAAAATVVTLTNNTNDIASTTTVSVPATAAAAPVVDVEIPNVAAAATVDVAEVLMQPEVDNVAPDTVDHMFSALDVVDNSFYDDGFPHNSHNIIHTSIEDFKKYNDDISMEFDNRFSESDKAAITEKLNQILPNNRDCVMDSFNLSPVSDPEQISDDDLALGASASPTETEPPTHDFSDEHITAAGNDGKNFKLINHGTNLYDDVSPKNTNRRVALPRIPHDPVSSSSVAASAARGYVGLVNQAMTCYLNSLLQALYMTPEFRNALYRWEFDQDNEAKNIPYQLQKLFLNLQTSSKLSVETTDLTRSFGWDSTEAWQQHDIQELCRVMFDALEHKSKNTKQAHFISNLYEGKMLDYVKCLECNTEKTREDTFLDIPLPVRPFGSSVAYGSIEEALRAFVQPETLDGNNQYFCECCNKKCDAHKGLKYSTFPYVLTLHLKRFDFDYQTMHRIKLNDRVTFPQTLNLNSFFNTRDGEALHNLQTGNGVIGATTNIDDCSTADSGSAMEEDNLSSGVVTTASSSQHENDMNDEDEGIDMSTSTDNRSSPNKSANVERTKQESGPYMYELFAIMIHSGSASGGHYYAYIKDFDNNEWFCFNDQTVTPITQEDIQKSFGGSSHSTYYSSIYSSSTNAYMLMYRQVDRNRNESAIKSDEFPEHIKTLLPKLQSEEESKSSRLGRHTTVPDLALSDLHKPRVYFYNPSMKKLKVTRIFVPQSFDVNHVLQSAHEMLDVDKFAPLERCRLVAYDCLSEEILQSLENITDRTLKDLRATLNYSLDFLLEYRAEGQEFEVYEKNGTTWHVYMFDPVSMAIDGPFYVYSAAHELSDVLRHSIAVRLHIKEDEFLLATLSTGLNKEAFVAYDSHPTAAAQEQLQTIVNTQLNSLTFVYLNVPNTDANNLEVMGIPPYETLCPPTVEFSTDVVDAVLMNAANSAVAPLVVGDTIDNFQQHGSYSRESPLPPPITTPGHESNSEDSSLSDGDRTLVESMQHRGGGDSQVSSTSHSPQLSSPEDEAASHDSYMRVQALYNGYSNDAVDTNNTAASNTAHFFHALKLETIDQTSIHTGSWSDSDSAKRKPTQGYKLIVHWQMRMAAFKRNIEQLIRVPANYFKIQRKNENNISNASTTLLGFLSDGETLTIELGKILRADEYKAKIYFMRLSDLNNETGKLPCICEWVYNASTTTLDAKKALVAKLHRMDPYYKSLTVENCRIWLKGGRSPIKILENDETLHSDVRTMFATEFLVQECEAGINPQPPEDNLTIFVRRWYPDKLQFGKFQEITLDKGSEIKNTLSQITDIAEENIEYTKMNTTFPCTNISVLSINGSMIWFSNAATMDNYPLATTVSAHVYFYKDATAPSKELTSEERIELNAKEKARLDRLCSISSASSYSPRRERGLKIHIDSPQKPTENQSSRSSSGTRSKE